MSVLNREEYFNRIQEIVGTDISDNAIKFVEDMSDTYNHLEEQLNGDGEDWKAKYDELNKSWKEKYRHRFFSTNGRSNFDIDNPNEPNNENITFNDLFK